MDHDGTKVRPLELEGADTAVPRRSWVPLLVFLVIGAVAAGLFSRGSTGTADSRAPVDAESVLIGEAGDAQPPTVESASSSTTSTTEIPPEPLRSLMPGFRGKLVLVGQVGTSSYVGEWLDGWIRPELLETPSRLDAADIDARSNEIAGIALQTSTRGVLFTTRDPSVPMQAGFSPVNSAVSWSTDR